ncbi:MAG TPA: DNA-directed RNA polymerase subunit alpha C-terminal domain-containing protein [Bacteroidia bacterium]|nr:DNA-directed RNA polymerase subunit alpha C-terminal domain-containing protein [Bacteroidia bacterium]
MAKKKTLKEQRIEELLQSLLLFGGLSKLEQTILTEVLINDKQFKDLTQSLRLTTYRQKQIFNTTTSRLMKALAVANENEDAYSAMKVELAATKKKLEALEKNNEERDKISPETKELLAIPIDKTYLSSRVKNVCYKADINKVSDLIKYSKRAFGGLRDSGKKSIDEVGAFLEAHGLSWK